MIIIPVDFPTTSQGIITGSGNIPFDSAPFTYAGWVKPMQTPEEHMGYYLMEKMIQLQIVFGKLNRSGPREDFDLMQRREALQQSLYMQVLCGTLVSGIILFA